jgi:hypothetical protein
METVFVPEGLTIVAWHEVPGTAPPEKHRPIGYGVVRAGVRTSGMRCARSFRTLYGTVLSRDAFPGTSCEATIAPSLRDKDRFHPNPPLSSCHSRISHIGRIGLIPICPDTETRSTLPLHSFFVFVVAELFSATGWAAGVDTLTIKPSARLSDGLMMT